MEDSMLHNVEASHILETIQQVHRSGMSPMSEAEAALPRRAWKFSGREDDFRPSLPEVHASVCVPHGASWVRRLLAFAGPGYMVSVGYMDPGNWATDLAGGAQFGYTLLAVIM